MNQLLFLYNNYENAKLNELRILTRIKLIYDLCTATAERRPTTAKDIEKDIHVETFNTEEELLNHVAKLVKYDEDDLADVDGETPLDKVEKIIEWCNDPDDGSPNFLYLSKNLIFFFSRE